MAQAQSAQTPADKDPVASAPNPYAGLPPRLCVCINEVDVQPNRLAKETRVKAELPPDYDLAVSGKALIRQILMWVAQMFSFSLDDVFSCSAGRPDWIPPEPAEEAWARQVSGMFIGCGYGGVNIAASFTEAKLRTPVGASIAYIFQRFQRDYIAWDDYAGQFWSAIKPGKDSERVRNTDPAYSLVTACQYLTTYGVLSRGFTIDGELEGIDLPARQCDSHPLFKGGAKGAHWYGTPPGRAQVKAAIANGQAVAPGTVYTFNPVGNMKQGSVMLTTAEVAELREKSKGKDGKPDQKKFEFLVELLQGRKIAAEQKERAAKGDPPADTSGKTPYEKGLDHPPIETPGMVNVKFPIRVQHTGSHISCVLRTWTSPQGSGLDMVQLLDTAGQFARVSGVKPERTEIPLVEKLGNGGIYDGNPVATVGAGEGTTFVGLGTLPPASALDAMNEHLSKVRPVGLARLVISARPQRQDSKGRDVIDIDNIFYMSELLLMWGPEEKSNGYPWRYLLSLRNIPYYKDVSAFWMIYAPRVELADVMWKEGARSLSLGEILAEAQASRAKKPPQINAKTKRDDKIDPIEMSTRDALLPVALFGTVATKVDRPIDNTKKQTSSAKKDEGAREDRGGVALLWQYDERKAGGGRGTPSKTLHDLLIRQPGPRSNQDEESPLQSARRNGTEYCSPLLGGDGNEPILLDPHYDWTRVA